MQEIRDCKGRLTCLADEKTGEIEARYKGAAENFPYRKPICKLTHKIKQSAELLVGLDTEPSL